MSGQADEFRNKAFMAAGISGLCLSALTAVGIVAYASTVIVGGPIGAGIAAGIGGVGLWKIGKPLKNNLKKAYQNGKYAVKAPVQTDNKSKPSLTNGILKTAAWSAVTVMAISAAVPTAMALPAIFGPIAAVGASSVIVGALGGRILNGALDIKNAVQMSKAQTLSSAKSEEKSSHQKEKGLFRLKQHLKELWHDSSYEISEEGRHPVRYSYDELSIRRDLKKAGVTPPPKQKPHSHTQAHEEGQVYPAIERSLGKDR